MIIKHSRHIVCIFLFFIGLLNFCSNVQKKDLVVIQASTMGTYYTIKVIPKDHEINSLDTRIDELLLDINMKMSTWIDSSEISRFNAFDQTTWFPVSKDLMTVFRQALLVSEKTDGAFDITIGPLVNLWGFGPEKSTFEIPAEHELKKCLLHVGYQKLKVRAEPPAIRKLDSKLYCDLSAIAKGYGVDKVADYIQSLGITDFFVDIGGEIKTRGRNQDNKPWKIGVMTPDDKFDIQKIIYLNDNAIATSGDYRNYFEKQGIRYSHTIDPRTGKPIQHKLASVSVVHSSCMIADAYATAITVLGPVDGISLANKENFPVYTIVRENNRFFESITPEFEKLTHP